jgi:hypothetical protein
MTQEEIKQKWEDVSKRLRMHDAARKLLEAEVLSLQHICEHPNMKRWSKCNYSGDTTSYEQCPDCGFRSCR